MKPQKQFNPLKSMTPRKPSPKAPVPDYVGKIRGPLGKPTQKLINTMADRAIKNKSK